MTAHNPRVETDPAYGRAAHPQQRWQPAISGGFLGSPTIESPQLGAAVSCQFGWPAENRAGIEVVNFGGPFAR